MFMKASSCLSTFFDLIEETVEVLILLIVLKLKNVAKNRNSEHLTFLDRQILFEVFVMFA